MSENTTKETAPNLSLEAKEVFSVFTQENAKEKFVIQSAVIHALTEVGQIAPGKAQFWIGKILKVLKPKGTALHEDLTEASKTCNSTELKDVLKNLLANKIELPINKLIDITVDPVESKYTASSQSVLDGLICNFILDEGNGTK